MKKLMLLLVAAGSILMVAGCAKSPSSTVEAWRDAIADGDAKKAGEYSTQNCTAINALFIGALQKQKDKAEEFKEAEVVDEKINGDTAVVTMKKDGEELKFDLIKVDGEWKIDVKK